MSGPLSKWTKLDKGYSLSCRCPNCTKGHRGHRSGGKAELCVVHGGGTWWVVRLTQGTEIRWVRCT